jgi:hypothetical protein
MAMKIITRSLIVLFFVVYGKGYANSQDKIELTGEIIARQRFEQMFRLCSFVINTEHYLFKIQGNPSKIIKLVHRFGGCPRDLADRPLSRLPELKIIVKTDPSCSETYEEFIKNAKFYSVNYAGEDIDPLVIYDKESINIDNATILECYIMSDREYEITRKNWGLREYLEAPFRFITKKDQ